MKGKSVRLLIAIFVFAMSATVGFGQATSTGSLSGTVTDQHGAVVAGATVVVKSVDTNQEYTTETSGDGSFSVPTLATGEYTATITASGFKQSIVTKIKIDVSKPSSISVALEVGSQNETVTVVGGGELVQTQSAVVGTTLTGRQIVDLPQASRDALDLVLFLPGTNTVGRPRQSTVNGLPKSLLNITTDGVNVQDNVLKGSDGFFTYIRPRIDAIQEVTVSTSTPGAESSGQGAVQIKFVTKGGTNEFHGSLYEYHRNKSLNSNFFWNNQLLAPKPHFGKPPSPSDKAPRTNILLNQFGGDVGGPIIIPKIFNGRDKAFFFVNYELYKLPESTLRVRRLLSVNAQNGIFQYGATQRNLYTIAAATDCDGVTPGLQPCPSTPDPTIAAILGRIRSAPASITPVTGDPNVDQSTFTNSGGQNRRFPTLRFDVNPTKKDHIEFIWNYQEFRSKVDFLNGADPAFIGFTNFGSQDSNRFSLVGAWRREIKANIVNEARYGLTGGTVLFFPQVNAGQFADEGGRALNISVAASGIQNPFTINAPQRRNAPLKQFSDNVSYVRGKHTMNIGVDFTQANAWLVSASNGAVPQANFGQDTSDIIEANMFTAANFPGSNATQRAQASTLYRVLTGRLTSIAHTAVLNEAGTTYEVNGLRIERYRQREIGMFWQDSYRMRPNLTVNFGLRYELQYAPVSLNKALTQNTFAGLFGLSGTNLSALFRPGATGGTLTQFNPLPPGQHLYDLDRNNFAPSFGFAWQPNFKGGLLGRLAGDTGQTVIRGGWSMAFSREGSNLTSSIVGANFGGALNLTQNAGTQFPRGTLLSSNPGLPATPAAPVYPLTPVTLNLAAGNAFTPDLQTPYVISFSASIQRELNKDMVLEIGYVGNRGHQLFRQSNLNEINVIENGFFNEALLAQRNLAANAAAGRCQAGVVTANCQFNFAYFGPGTGTFPLPTFLAYFSAQPAGSATNPALYTSTFFRNTSFTNRLVPTNTGPTTLAGLLNNPLNGFFGNAIAAGLPANLFVVNPQLAGGSFIVDNDGKSWYDAMTIELRRRLAKGVLVNTSYTFGKSQTNMYVSSAIAFAQPNTLRNTWLNKTESPFDIRHSVKATYIVELPFGRGKTFLGNSSGIVNGLLGGWTTNGTLRMQSGAPLNLGNVQLVGMTSRELEDAVRIRFGPNRQVYWLPQDIIDNTIAAFATTGTTLSGYSGAAPVGRYIAPAGANGCVQRFPGDCGFSQLIIHGPKFVRSDMSIVKRIGFSEKTNLEIRFEMLNVFKNSDFRLGQYTADAVNIGAAGIPTYTSSQFGQLTTPDTAYRDTSTTNDPGGRVGQIVIRFNF